MASDAWQDMIVGDRMQVDREFADRVREAGFSNQEWGLIMTAVDLKIEGEGEAARMVADTSMVDHIMPELGRIRKQGYGMGQQGQGSTEGLLGAIKSSLGLGGGGVDEETRRNADRLAQEYATTLQAHLEENGRWKRVVAASG